MSNRIAAFDNLKFIAILGVILYHYFGNIFSGGFLGVDMFFIISGLLLAFSTEKHFRGGRERTSHDEILRKLIGFIKPLVLFLAGSLALLVVVKPGFLNNVQGEVISSLLFVNNWYQIFSGKSYFDNFINPSVFTHLWYISMYMQILVLWYVFYPKIRRKFKGDLKKIRDSILLIALASGLLMFVLSFFVEDPTRLYYGTDTRIFSFLFGAIAGLKVFDQDLEAYEAKDLDIRILFAFALVMVSLFAMKDTGNFTYRFGIFGFSAIFAYMLYLLTSIKSLARRFLSFEPTALIGASTLPIYLWYYPIFMIFYQTSTNTSITWIHGVFQVLMIFVIAFVFLLLYNKLDNLEIPVPKVKYLPFALLIGLVLFLSPRKDIAGDLKAERERQKEIQEAQNEKNRAQLIGDRKTEKTENNVSTEVQKATEAGEVKDLAENSGVKEGLTGEESQITEDIDTALKQELEAYKSELEDYQMFYYEFLTEEEALEAYSTPATFFGDSLILLASEGLSTVFPKSTIYSEVALHLSDAFAYAQEAVNSGVCADNVGVFIGSNGGFSKEEMEDYLSIFGDRKIYLITTHVDRFWRDEVNGVIGEVVESNPNVNIIDWETYFADNGEPESWLREEDDIHFTLEGTGNFIKYIISSLGQ